MSGIPASHDDYCPYPGPDAPFLTDMWSISLLLLLGAVVAVLIFKWYTRQRLVYFIVQTLVILLVPLGLDTEKAPSWVQWLMHRMTYWIFAAMQDKVPTPPQHLISSAPSNCPGILTMTKTCRRAGCDGKETNCKYHCIVTSDDVPILPDQPRIFRTVDGFGNCPYSPHIGQAAQPYSFLLVNKKPPQIDLGGNVIEKELPKVEQIFEKLLKREKDTFEPNEAGLNCIILDFAMLLTHDLFNSRSGYNKNSSYADLSPLYGNDPASAKHVRRFEKGLLDLKKVPSSRAAKLEEAADAGLIPQAGSIKLSIAKTLAKHQEVRGEESAAYTAENEALLKLLKDSQEYNWDWGFAGWRALVELFGREHNYVAEMLLREYPERFPYKAVEDLLEEVKKLQEEKKQQELEKLQGEIELQEKRNAATDEALYQTARYITTRVYGNIVVTDYACNFLGLKQMNSFFLERPNRLGNSCSYEFGLLYHWHCLLPDDSPGADVKKGVPCLPSDATFKQRGPLDGDYYDCIGGPPNKRTFEKLIQQEADKRKEEAKKEADKRKAEADKLKKASPDNEELKNSPDNEKLKKASPDNDDSFVDDESPVETVVDLERLLLTRYKTRIGRFGAFHTPEYMKKAEMRTMKTARQLGAGSYNDFRQHLNLMRCKTYEEINPDKKVAGALRQLYKTDASGNDNIDDVELYPGIFAERSGVNGIKFGSTLSLGLLEDALNLIRNDRLLVDFDPNTATPKGYQHAVSSHLADVIERNTNLRLVKQQEGPDRLVEYKSTYKSPTDWRHWRLASCALMTVPGVVGSAKKLVFGSEGIQPAELKLYVDPEAFDMGRWAGIQDAKRRPSVSLDGLEANGYTPTSQKAAEEDSQETPTSVLHQQELGEDY